MKSLSALVLTAGLVSAVSVAPSPVANEASSNGQAESIANIFNSSVGLNGSQIDSASPNFDPASLNLNNLGGVNLGQVDFSNQDSIASAILSMLNVLCAGNLFDVNSILDLGLNNDLELFLELVQLMQLEQLGFLNVFDIQSLLGSGFGSGFSSGFGSSLVGTSNSNAFNLGTSSPGPLYSIASSILTRRRLLQARCLRAQEDDEEDQTQEVSHQDQEAVPGKCR